MHRHQRVVSSLSLLSGIPIAVRRSMKLNTCIKILVEVPKPLSIKRTGMVSSRIREVAQRRTPLVSPKKKRPRHISLKLNWRDIIEPIRPNILNMIIVFLGPSDWT